jgi:hypothetical protein
LAKGQLSKTSSPDIANGAGKETETDVQAGRGDFLDRPWSFFFDTMDACERFQRCEGKREGGRGGSAGAFRRLL